MLQVQEKASFNTFWKHVQFLLSENLTLYQRAYCWSLAHYIEGWRWYSSRYSIFENFWELSDALTLQMIRLMDKVIFLVFSFIYFLDLEFWRLRFENATLWYHFCCPSNNLAAVSTGNFVGMIEVVLNSTTIGDIYEKKAGVKSVWDKNVLKEWVREQANTGGSYVLHKLKRKTPNTIPLWKIFYWAVERIVSRHIALVLEIVITTTLWWVNKAIYFVCLSHNTL